MENLEYLDNDISSAVWNIVELEKSLDIQIEKNRKLKQVQSKVDNLSTTIDDIAVMQQMLFNEDIINVTGFTRAATSEAVTIACEDMDAIIETIKKIIRQFIDILKRMLGYASKLSIALKTDLRQGKLSNPTDEMANKLQEIKFPFYKSGGLTKALADISSVDFTQIDLNADSLEEAAKSLRISDAFKFFGVEFDGATVSHGGGEKNTTDTLSGMGYSIKDLVSTAMAIQSTIEVRIRINRLQIKKLKRELKRKTNADMGKDAVGEKKRLMFAMRLVSEVDSVVNGVARDMLSIIERL